MYYTFYGYFLLSMCVSDISKKLTFFHNHLLCWDCQIYRLIHYYNKLTTLLLKLYILLPLTIMGIKTYFSVGLQANSILLKHLLKVKVFKNKTFQWQKWYFCHLKFQACKIKISVGVYKNNKKNLLKLISTFRTSNYEQSISN